MVRVARLARCRRRVASLRKAESRCVDMANGVGAGSHGGGVVGGRVLAHTVGTRSCGTGTFAAAISGSRGGCCCHVQFLLMPEQQITTSEAPRAVGTFKGLLLCVRPLVTLQVLQSREGSATGCANMRSRLVCFGRGVIAIDAGLSIGLGLLF